MPLDWATTQNNLGNALSMLGSRESGRERLEEAVLACRAALKERARERTPLQWAQTQDNLGKALWRLGKRVSSPARLEEALLVIKSAFEVRVGEAKQVRYVDYYLDRIKALEADIESMKEGCER